jgi:phosphotransferase system  glucose/maltose/N-acetylglucosamine-specific IIC component
VLSWPYSQKKLNLDHGCTGGPCTHNGLCHRGHWVSFFILGFLFVCLFVFGWDWGLNSGLWTGKAGGLPLEPCPQSLLLCLFWRWGLQDYLPGLVLEGHPLGWALVAHACNPSYSGGKDQGERGLKPAWANSSRDLSELFAWAGFDSWLWTTILLISASWAVRITGVSYWYRARVCFLRQGLTM